MKSKIGVYICYCGSNISDYVDVEKVKEKVKDEQGVFISKTMMFACADSAQKEIVDDIINNNLDSIVVASCSPKLHVPTFREVAKRAGLNPYNYVQVNIREQTSWAHSDNPKEATEKAINLIKAGIARVRESISLETIKIPAKKSVLVIGAGISGMRAAIEMADLGANVFLIDKEHFIGGRLSQWGVLFTVKETGKELITRVYEEVIKRKNIKLFTGAEIISKTGNTGNFKVEIKINPRYISSKCTEENFQKVTEICPIEIDDEFNFGITKRKAIFKNFESEFPRIPVIDMENCNRCGECAKICDNIDLDEKPEILNLNVGAIIVCTGFDPYEPKQGEFAYKEIDNVITLQQFKRIIDLNNNKELVYKNKNINNVVYIYCVGSRQLGELEGENKYCSRYCCTSAIHTSILIKEKYENINNFHFTRGIRTYGKQELLYDDATQKGDIFFQSFEDSPPVVEKIDNKTIVKIFDVYTDMEELEVEADLVVLITGMVPRKDNKVVEVLKTPIGRDKFLNEIHLKLRPVETVIDGVFIAGASQGPKNIIETTQSSLAAASKACSLICEGEIELEPTIAKIDKDACKWCDKCLAVCPYNAISKTEYNGKQIAVINNSICKGCGMCTPVCPVDAIDIIGYTNDEIENMISILAQ